MEEIVYLLNVTCLCRKFRCNKKTFSCIPVCLFCFSKSHSSILIRCSSVVLPLGGSRETNFSALTLQRKYLFSAHVYLCLNRNVYSNILIWAASKVHPIYFGKIKAWQASFLGAVMLDGGALIRREVAGGWGGFRPAWGVAVASCSSHLWRDAFICSLNALSSSFQALCELLRWWLKRMGAFIGTGRWWTWTSSANWRTSTWQLTGTRFWGSLSALFILWFALQG